MRFRKAIGVVTIVVVGAFLGLLVSLTRVSGRVVSKQERVQVLSKTGMWYHEFTVTVKPTAAGSQDDHIEVRATQAQFDALRIGVPADVFRVRRLEHFTWLGDESIGASLIRGLSARTMSYHAPVPMSVSKVSTEGLARVISVHRIMQGKKALEIVVVEFWAQRMRTLVRTADVVDARSIPDLGPGQVLQMHYDPRNPRVLRLDDGTRSL